MAENDRPTGLFREVISLENSSGPFKNLLIEGKEYYQELNKLAQQYNKKYEELSKPFAKAVEEAVRPREIFYNERDSERVEEYFKLMENNDKTNMEKQNDISKLLNKKGDFYFSFGDGNKITENVWNLLDNNAEDAFQILTENYKEIIIAITPIEGTSKFIITYIFSK